jgi:recombination protein RecT
MANEVATTGPKPEIVKFREQLEQRASELKMALPSHITPEKFQRTVITACQSDPELLKADRQSLVLACMKAAQDALLPDKREAAIVIFKENKKTNDGWQTKLIATYMPMVYGLRKKILQSGEVVALEVGVVYRAEVEAGKFIYEVGLEPPLRHRPMLELTLEQTSDDQIVAAYSIATMKDGTKSYEVMRRFEIDRVRETSKTGATKDRQGKARQPSGPWLDWFPEMAKKTVMRRHAKTLPQSGDIIVDIEGQELDAGRSTALALGSTEPDAPQLSDQRPDGEELPPHDSETGELHEEGGAHDNQNATDGASDSNEQAEKPKRARRTKAQIDADNAAAAKAKAEPRDATDAEVDRANRAGLAEGESTVADDLTQGEPASDEVDELGITKHPAEAKAEEIIADMDQAATIIDVDRIYNDAADDCAAMPDEIVKGVSEAWSRNRKRVRGER